MLSYLRPGRTDIALRQEMHFFKGEEEALKLRRDFLTVGVVRIVQ